MRLLRVCLYDAGAGNRVGTIDGDRVYDLHRCCVGQMARGRSSGEARQLAETLVPDDLGQFISGGDAALSAAREAVDWAEAQGDEGLFLATSAVRLKAPILPSTKVACMGGVFPTHLQIAGVEPHVFPVPFYKMSQVVVGPDEWVIIPKHHQEPVVGGAELAVVIGKAGRSIPVDAVEEHIWGYTVLNDVTLRGEPNPIHKVFETSAPIGPWLVPKGHMPNPHNARLMLRINGVLVQDGNTRDMLATIPEMVSEVSKWLALGPGDIIATGDLGAMDTISPGDVMEAEVEGVGVLRNPIKLEE